MPITSKRVHSSNDESEEMSEKEGRPSKRKRPTRTTARDFILDDVEVASASEEGEEDASDEDALNQLGPSERVEAERAMCEAITRPRTRIADLFSCAVALSFLWKLLS